MSDSRYYKPNWDESPFWAQWVAVDESGIMCWYEFQPMMGDGFWIHYDGGMSTHKIIKEVQQGKIDWRSTLRVRPR
jgi:hypothetical protein